MPHRYTADRTASKIANDAMHNLPMHRSARSKGAAVCGRWEQGGNAVLRTAWSLTLQVAMNCVFSCDDLLQT